MSAPRRHPAPVAAWSLPGWWRRVATCSSSKRGRSCRRRRCRSARARRTVVSISIAARPRPRISASPIVAGAGVGGGRRSTGRRASRRRTGCATSGTPTMDWTSSPADRPMLTSSASAPSSTSTRRPWSLPKDRAILDGAAALGWEHALTERNAGPCTDCGACGFGCRVGAKRSGLRAHLAAAHAGGARVLADATVEQVAFEPVPRRASGAACDRRQAIRGGRSPFAPARWWLRRARSARPWSSLRAGW